MPLVQGGAVFTRGYRCSSRLARFSLSVALSAVCGLVASGCQQAAVAWGGDPVPLGGALTDASVLVLRGVPDDVRAVPQAVPVPQGGLPPLGAGSCLASIRFARPAVEARRLPPGERDEVAAVWWAARPDSSVVLDLARSADDGAHWDTTMVADARDRGVRGCGRPPPAIASDPVSGYTHLAYFLEPAPGAGVFYEHLMDLPVASAPGAAARRIAMFHAPVAIVYGEVPRRASVTGHGDTVAVAYEDPNRAAPQIALAVSVTAGHTFAPAVPASGDNVEARDPVIGLDRASVAVAWRESAIRADGAADTSALARGVVRTGTFR
jgi:hypothetical protein